MNYLYNVYGFLETQKLFKNKLNYIKTIKYIKLIKNDLN